MSAEPGRGGPLLARYLRQPAAVLDGLRGRWRGLAADIDVRRGRIERDLAHEGSLDEVRAQVAACLEERGGEPGARARAARLGLLYLELSDVGRRRFLRHLAEEHGAGPTARDAARAYLETPPDDPGAARAERALRAALVPRRVALLRQFSTLPDGVKFLVDLRADCLRLAREEPALRDVADDLRELLRTWFDPGLLELRHLTWDSPASLLERLAATEAVHAVRDWEDLKNRLAADRRIFAFVHPAMPREPVIFIEVALLDHVAHAIAPLLDVDAPSADPARADVAIFYSISSAQAGLVGISLGGLLIKRVVDALRAELPRLATFATLSPMPGFRAYVDEVCADGDPLSEEEHTALGCTLAEALARVGWPDDPALADALRDPLRRLGARYLLDARRPDGRARDAVAHFHLGNGAAVDAINHLADPSPKGLAQSYGLMVNYRYELDEIERRLEAYRARREVAASGRVERLAR